MKSIDEVQAYFETYIKPNLNVIEEWRIKTRKKYLIINGGCAIPTGILFLVMLANLILILFNKNSDPDSILGQLIGIPLVMIVPLAIYFVIRYFLKEKSGEKKWKLRFKEETVGKIVRFLDKKITYHPGIKFISGEEFLGGELFEHVLYYPGAYAAEDIFEWKAGETKVKFYEINGNVKIFTQPHTYKGAIEKIPFFGFFLIADFNKSFSGHTLVLPEAHIEKSNWISESGRELIRMDNPEFESLFSVYGSDPITTYYILSTSLMSRITELRKKIGKKIRLSFTHNKLYLAIPHEENQFELKFNKSVYDFERMREFYQDIKLAYDLVEDLNLNTRIWSRDQEPISRLHNIPSNYSFRKQWLFSLFSLTLGYLGVHYFYAGYYLKGIKFLLTTLSVSAILIYGILFGNKEFMVLYYAAAFVFGFVWFILVTIFALMIKHDSKGIPMK